MNNAVEITGQFKKNKTHIINRATATAILEGLQQLHTPAHFGVVFKKRSNGAIRKMTASFKVKRGVRSHIDPNCKGLRFNPKKKNLFVVHDMQKAAEGVDPSQCKRMINNDALIQLTFNKRTFIVID